MTLTTLLGNADMFPSDFVPFSRVVVAVLHGGVPALEKALAFLPTLRLASVLLVERLPRAMLMKKTHTAHKQT